MPIPAPVFGVILWGAIVGVAAVFLYVALTLAREALTP